MIVHLIASGAGLLCLGALTTLGVEPLSPGGLVALVIGVNAGLVVGRRLEGLHRPHRRARRQATSNTPEPSRLGLADEAAQRLAGSLRALAGVEAVEISDRARVLGSAARAGVTPHDGVLDGSLCAQAITRGGPVAAAPHTCQQGCGLNAGAAAPLVCDGEVVGGVALYAGASDGRQLERVARASAELLSEQLELAHAGHASRLDDLARLNALRAQINPHFVFNTLNTIAMKARTDAEEARRLLVRLSDFLRYAMKSGGHTAPFSEEYFFVRTYLFLEKARYGDRLRIRYDIDPQVMPIPVPVLTIQPLVENAVKHGVSRRPEGGRVELWARLEPVAGRLRIRVRDDGVGIGPAALPDLLEADGTQLNALANIHERLLRLYRGRASFDLRSTPGKGTEVALSIPIG